MHCEGTWLYKRDGGCFRDILSPTTFTCWLVYHKNMQYRRSSVLSKAKALFILDGALWGVKKILLASIYGPEATLCAR